jgi:hypothetical protein
LLFFPTLRSRVSSWFLLLPRCCLVSFPLNLMLNILVELLLLILMSFWDSCKFYCDFLQYLPLSDPDPGDLNVSRFSLHIFTWIRKQKRFPKRCVSLFYVLCLCEIVCLFCQVCLFYWNICLFACCDLCVGVSHCHLCFSVFKRVLVCVPRYVVLWFVVGPFCDLCTFWICSGFSIFSITFSFSILRHWMVDKVHKYNSFNTQN